MDRYELIALHKAGMWEQAKGCLRATVAIAGQCGPTDKNLVVRYTELSKKIEAFIKDVEDHALEE